MSKDYYVCVVGKDDVQSGTIIPVLKMIEQLETIERLGTGTAFRSLAIVLHGYDNTEEELWEIQEVRNWAHKLINKIPHLFYYIEYEYTQTEVTLMLCMNNYRLVSVEDDDSGAIYNFHVDVHQKSFRQMSSELRKFAKKNDKSRAAIELLIHEMKDRYGIEDDNEEEQE